MNWSFILILSKIRGIVIGVSMSVMMMGLFGIFVCWRLYVVRNLIVVVSRLVLVVIKRLFESFLVKLWLVIVWVYYCIVGFWNGSVW